MKAEVDEVAGDVHEEWPFDCVGDDEADVVAAEKVDEVRDGEALVADFDAMAEGVVMPDGGPGACSDRSLCLRAERTAALVERGRRRKKAAVKFEGGELAARVFQFAALWEFEWGEDAAPAGIAPA